MLLGRIRVFWNLEYIFKFLPVEGFSFCIGLLTKVDHAPRKFKNLGTDAFIASLLTKIFLVIQDAYAIKVWGPVKKI